MKISAPLAYFRGYKAHRMARKQIHKLDTIIAITLAAIISGAESWYDVEDIGIRIKHGLVSFWIFQVGFLLTIRLTGSLPWLTAQLWRSVSVNGFPL